MRGVGEFLAASAGLSDDAFSGTGLIGSGVVTPARRDKCLTADRVKRMHLARNLFL